MATDFAQNVKQQADIVRIIGEYVRLKKSGAQNFSGLCPFHAEKSPSFSVHAGRQFFHCFGCGQSGDVFTFVQKIENISFPEAVRTVAQKCGIALPKREFSSPEEAGEHRQRARLIELHEAATQWFEEQLRLPEGAAARSYLLARGMDEKGIARFRIGYAPESFHALRERLANMADVETLRLSGLFSWKEQEDGQPGPIYARFRKRITFPIANEGGRVIAFTARTIESGDKAGPKYINSPETPLYSKGQVLFNLDKARQPIREADFAVLVEGQMDCISASLAGIPNVLATSGTAFTEMQARLLARYSKRVIVNFDPDTAGANAAEKSIGLLTEEGFEVKIVTLEGGLDPDRFLREHGVRGYMDALRGARRYQDYLIERARIQFPPRSPEAKVKALNYLLPHIRRVPNAIARNEFASDVAQALGVDSSLLREELKQAVAKRRDFVASPQSYPLTRAEQILLMAFAAQPGTEARSCAEAEIASHSEEFARLREDVQQVVALLRGRGEGTDALSAMETPEQRQMLASLFVSVHDAEPAASQVAAAMLTVRRIALEQQQRELRGAILEAERTGRLAEAIEKTRVSQQLAQRLRELE